MYYHFKTDIFKGEMVYSTDKSVPANLVTLTPDRVVEVIALNKQGIKPERLDSLEGSAKPEKKEFGDIVGQNSLTRFDKNKKRSRNKNQQGQKQRDPKAEGQGKRQPQPKQQGQPQQPKPQGQPNRQQRNQNRNRNNKNNNQPANQPNPDYKPSNNE